MSESSLSFFDRITSRERKPADEKTYPGTTPPRNAGPRVDTNAALWLTSLPSSTFLVNGEERKFYTIGALATALGKKPVTIRSWEQKGWLPAASYRTPPPSAPQVPGKAVKGRRLYTQEQVVFLVEMYTKYVEECSPPNWTAFRHVIKRQYPSK